jgi:hypothetical protein
VRGTRSCTLRIAVSELARPACTRGAIPEHLAVRRTAPVLQRMHHGNRFQARLHAISSAPGRTSLVCISHSRQRTACTNTALLHAGGTMAA